MGEISFYLAEQRGFPPIMINNMNVISFVKDATALLIWVLDFLESSKRCCKFVALF